MNKSKYLIIIILLSLSFKSYSQQKVASAAFDKMLKVILSRDIQEMAVADVSIAEDLLLVDAREKNEYEVSHLPKAIWIGYDEFDIERLAAIPKDQKITVYCSIGYRSEKIAKKLLENGYDNVSNLYGGIFEWTNQGNKVYNDQGETTKVHAFNRLWSVWLNKGEKVY